MDKLIQRVQRKQRLLIHSQTQLNQFIKDKLFILLFDNYIFQNVKGLISFYKNKSSYLDNKTQSQTDIIILKTVDNELDLGDDEDYLLTNYIQIDKTQSTISFHLNQYPGV